MTVRHAHGKRKSLFSRYFSWPGLFILSALVLGGGTRTALASDFMLQLLALPLLWRMIMNMPRKLPWPAGIFMLALAVLFVWQLWPSWSPGELTFPHTLDAGRTIHAMLIVLVPVALFYNVLLMPAHRRARLAAWFMAGVALNAGMAFLQFASRTFAQLAQPFSWTMKAGFFANENHLAALLVMTVPVLIALFRKTPWPYLSAPFVLLLVMFEMVVGSRAGVAMILASAMTSYLLLTLRPWKGLLAILLILSATVFALWRNGPLWLETLMPKGNFNRLGFWKNTWRALQDHFPWGTGLDTFTLVYPKYENQTDIISLYVNHAHNDWLELLLEGGAFSIALAILFLAAMIYGLAKNHSNMLVKAAFLAAVFIMIHSLLDYPLRTLALSVSFALWLAFILADWHEDEHSQRPARRHRREERT